MRKLLILTAAVALAHVLLLGGLPSGIGFHVGSPDSSAEDAPNLRFETRTIAAAPRPTPPHDPVPVLTKPAPQQRVAPPPEAIVQTPVPEPAVADSAATSQDAPAVVAAAPQPSASAPALLAAAKPEPMASASIAPSPLAASTAAAAGAEVRRAQKVSFAEPVRLLYDGKGEEKGYIKYNASGEILWLPDAMQYSARLELSAFGFRLRTWTSKGELTDSGLQPSRFGDKPRGAEQATHFQRDKGIISFSANNPDVPLQAGAQDKLSALLQLSAMAAGDPGRYPAGSIISFQAADAHRAEPWDFKVGAAEVLELPGGTLSGIKFSKEPTVEFDQRIEVWLAPDMRYLPVRIRITEASGAFADLLWRKSQKPD